ncbi:MAG: sterol desaturase family protein [Myxococcota bacterium]
MGVDVNVWVTLLLVSCMAAEGFVGWWRATPVYRFADTVSDFVAGLVQLAVQAALGVSLVLIYTGFTRFALFELPLSSPLAWGFAYLVTELVLYWRHRAGHEIAALWAVHEVHHQSSEFNYAVGQRISVFQWVQTALFVWPLALIGIPVPMFAALFGVIHFYNFLLHTKLIGQLGPLEHLLQTPALHRVHHGRNGEYIDKNYGFSITLYDRLFGTHQPEERPVDYGTTQPLPTYRMLHNHFAPFAHLASRMRNAGSPRLALEVALRHPGWDPATRALQLPAPGPAGPRVTPAAPVDGPRAALAIGALLAGLVATLALTQLTPVLSWPARLAGGLVTAVLLGAATHFAPGDR